MIITRSPLRVSFLGGGTDIPWFFEKYGHGSVFSAAIDKYIYISGHGLFDSEEILLKYSKTERVESAGNLQHPIAREVFKQFNIKGLDVAVSSDVPAGTGLGSSSAFTVGLVQLAAEISGRTYDKNYLADTACETEILKVGEPIGKQDQYASAFGGLNGFTFRENSTEIAPSKSSLQAELDGTLLLLKVGKKSRSASEMLAAQASAAQKSSEIEKSLLEMRDIADSAINNKELNFSELCELTNLSWELKKRSNPFATSPEIDTIIESGINAGAQGAKLLGAGGGGFVLFLGEPAALTSLRETFIDSLQLGVKLDLTGSKVIYRSDQNEH